MGIPEVCSGYRIASMSAAIEKCTDSTLSVSSDNDRVFTHRVGKEIADIWDLTLVAEEKPTTCEDEFQFLLCLDAALAVADNPGKQDGDGWIAARAALDQARELLESMTVAEALVESDITKGLGGYSHNNVAPILSGKVPLDVNAFVENSVIASADLFEKNDPNKLKPIGDKDVKPVLEGIDTVAAGQLV